MWALLTMSECWDLLNPSPSGVFIKPNFPSKRWGQTTTKESTTDKNAIKKILLKLEEKGIKSRKRIHRGDTDKFKRMGTFYKIEIKK